MSEARPRLGVLGGSFDPPHIGHLVIASEACAQLALERVLFAPAASPPHKAPGLGASAAARLEMTALAIADDERVGGDFYDVFEMSPGVVAVVVGDVSGKGLDAAVLTSVVKNAIRAQAFDGEKAPADVLRVVNEVLLRGSAPEVFASVFLGVIDGRRSVMDYCNAGHTPALVLRDGGVVEQLPPTSPVVGAFPELTYSSARTRLAPGELLFLYTDGLVEARVNGVLFGEAGLLALFAEPGMSDVATAVERAASAVFEFADGRLSDDLALLAISPTVGHSPSAQGGLRSSGHDMPD